jgi:hypothetical protein
MEQAEFHGVYLSLHMACSRYLGSGWLRKLRPTASINVAGARRAEAFDQLDKLDQLDKSDDFVRQASRQILRASTQLVDLLLEQRVN